MTTFEPWDPHARLLLVERRIAEFRRRFWWALAGYVILAVGLVAASFIIVNQAQELEDTQRGVIELVRCADHPKAPDCGDLPTYNQLLEEIE